MKHEGNHNAVSEGQAEQASGWLLVNPRILVGLVGAVACFAWLFLMVGTSAFIPYVGLASPAVGSAHFLFVVGACVALFVTWAFSNELSSYRLVHYALAVACTLTGCVGLWILREQDAFLWAPALLSGCGFGFLYTLYGEYVCLFFYGSVKPYIHGIFACATIACAGLLFAGREMSFFFALLFPLVALVAYALQLCFFRLQDRPPVDRKVSDGRHRVVWRSYLATATSGMAAGFALGCLLSTQTVHSWVYVAVEALVAATCLFLLFDSLKLDKVNETVTMRFFLPLSAVVVFPLIFVPDDLKFVFALLLLCGSLFPTTCSLSAICKHIVICDLSAIRAFSFGRLMSFLGIALGLAVAFVGFAPAAREAFGTVISAASVVAFMLLVIFSASFVMTEDNYPDERRFRGADADGNAAPIAPGTPIRKIEAAVADEPEEGVEEPAAPRPGVFHVKCEIVAKKYGLSNRQREVLGMLAKGRNADYITEKLVISSHTAKAHIYNIYQKTGVHSRQELMDLVENTDVHEAGKVLEHADPFDD